MCGRVEEDIDFNQLVLDFDDPTNVYDKVKPKKVRWKQSHRQKTERMQGFVPNYDLRPTQMLPVITNLEPDEVQPFRWGLLPRWAKELKESSYYINARSETLFEKPAWRNLVGKKHCIIPATGYFEWKEIPGEKKKQKYRFSIIDQDILFFAGLWETWKNPADQTEVQTCTIITTDSEGWMRDIHDRAPVILPPGQEELWLQPDINPRELLKDLPAELIMAEAV